MRETMAFQIIILYRQFLAYTKQELKKLGLSFGLMPLVIYVGKHPNCTQAELTKALRLDWGYSQRSVTRLTDAGFMTKECREEGNCLALTERGKQAFDVSHRVFEEWDERRMKDLTDHEKSTVTGLLKKITGEKQF